MPASVAGLRLDQALALLLPEQSRSRLAALIEENAVLLEGAHAAGKKKIRGGEKVVVTLKPREEDLAFQPEPIAFAIIHEDDVVMVIDKPPGLVVHPAAGNWTGTLLNGLLHHAPSLARIPRAGIVHRLDKDTSGVMVAAKTEAAQTSLVRQLQARTMKRIYVALVRGKLTKDGSVATPIGRHPHHRTRMAVVKEHEAGKPAVTHYRVLERFAFHTLVECRLETGRTHQIRVHMQSIGYPLEGDTVYGPTMTGIDDDVRAVIRDFGRQALHARKLSFDHPVECIERTFEAPIPDDKREFIDFASGLG